jgi:hypothetical protein
LAEEAVQERLSITSMAMGMEKTNKQVVKGESVIVQF